MIEKNILNIIERKIILIKKESTHWGVCPFCKPATVTFAVHKETNSFRCYCCNTYGDEKYFLELFDG